MNNWVKKIRCKDVKKVIGLRTIDNHNEYKVVLKNEKTTGWLRTRDFDNVIKFGDLVNSFLHQTKMNTSVKLKKERKSESEMMIESVSESEVEVEDESESESEVEKVVLKKRESKPKLKKKSEQAPKTKGQRSSKPGNKRIKKEEVNVVYDITGIEDELNVPRKTRRHTRRTRWRQNYNLYDSDGSIIDISDL